MEKPIIEIENVKKRYRMGQINGGTLTADLQSWWARIRGKEDPNIPLFQDQRLIGQSFMALNGVSFTVNKGEAVAIIGGNGAGKSTLLKILSRITAPTEGRIVLRGRVTSMLEVGTGFNGEMTGRENIYMNGAILGMTKEEIDNKMEEIISFSECGDFIDTPVKRYSSGMFVKLAFAVAAHLDSEIMVMDEVLAVGDAKFQKKCLGRMSNAANSEGKTVLYVSHNMSTVRQLCTRAIVLKEGRMIYDGDVETGISIYSEENLADQMSQSYDLADAEQERKKVAFKQIQMLNFTNKITEQNRFAEIKLQLHSFVDDDSVRVRCVLFNKLDSAVGTLLTKDIAMEKDSDYELKIKLDMGILACDKYAIDFRVGHMFALHAEDYDFKPKCLSFSIDDNELQKGTFWNIPYMGNLCIDSGNVEIKKTNG